MNYAIDYKAPVRNLNSRTNGQHWNLNIPDDEMQRRSEYQLCIDPMLDYDSIASMIMERYGNFVEEILDDLKEEMLARFFIRAISCFTVPEVIFITTDGYHYESILETVASRMCMVIKRQRCLFHIEEDLAHKIENAKKENDLDMARKLIRYMFFQNEKNIKNIGNNMESVIKLTDGKDEREIVSIIMDKLTSLYGDVEIISHFLDFVKKHRKEVFLYLENMEVEKTSDLAEQHFAIMSWLLKHRFKTKEGLLRVSYCYHR